MGALGAMVVVYVSVAAVLDLWPFSGDEEVEPTTVTPTPTPLPLQTATPQPTAAGFLFLESLEIFVQQPEVGYA